MPADRRRPFVVFLIPMIVLLSAITRIADHVRAVDFLQLFGGGAVFGACLVGFIQMLKTKEAPRP